MYAIFKVTFHLQLLPETYIPHIVQYILITYLTLSGLYLLLPHSRISFPSPLPTGNQKFLLYACDSAPFLSYSAVCHSF